MLPDVAGIRREAARLDRLAATLPEESYARAQLQAASRNLQDVAFLAVDLARLGCTVTVDVVATIQLADLEAGGDV